MMRPFRFSFFTSPGKLGLLLVQTGILFTVMAGILFWGRLSPRLFIQGIDLLVIPFCALIAAFRLPTAFPKLHLLKESAHWLTFFALFFCLRVLANTWAYGGRIFDFPHGPAHELGTTLIVSTFFFAFFRCCHFGYAYMRYKKATSLRWKLTHHLMIFGVCAALTFLLLSAFIYAFSPAVTSFLQQDLTLFSELMHRVTLGFLTFFAVGFTFMVLASPLFFSLCAGASFFSAKPITKRLADLSKATMQLQPGQDALPTAEHWQDETASLQNELQATLKQWSETLAQLKQERLAQEALFKSHRDLVAKVSHELRNPLTAAKCFLETVKQNPSSRPDAERSHELRHLEDQLNCFQSLLEDLPGNSNSSSSPWQVQCRLGNLGGLVQKMATQWRPIAWGRYRVSLGVQIPITLNPIAFDTLRMRQVLVNLIHNALRFSQPGGVVMLVLSETAAVQKIEVRDTGSGIAPEDLELIWQPYVTCDDPEKSQTGLGLALVKEFIASMAGQIQVQSTPGEGTVFSIILPKETKTISRHSLESSMTSSS